MNINRINEDKIYLTLQSEQLEMISKCIEQSLIRVGVFEYNARTGYSYEQACDLLKDIRHRVK